MRLRSLLASSAVLVGFLAFPGCDMEARLAMNGAVGTSQHVSLYSGGQLVREWKTKGRALAENGSDGWFFKDAATGKLIRVSGDVVIEAAAEK